LLAYCGNALDHNRIASFPYETEQAQQKTHDISAFHNGKTLLGAKAPPS